MTALNHSNQTCHPPWKGRYSSAVPGNLYPEFSRGWAGVTPKGPLAGDRGHGYSTYCRAASDTARVVLVGAITTQSSSAPSQTTCSLSRQSSTENRETFSQRDSSCTAILRPGSKVPTSSVPKGQSRGCLELPCKALQGQETRKVLLTHGVNSQERMQVPRMDIVGLEGAEQSASG